MYVHTGMDVSVRVHLGPCPASNDEPGKIWTKTKLD